MSNEWLSDSQVEAINKVIDTQGRYRLGEYGIQVFGGLDNLQKYFDVRARADGGVDLRWKPSTTYYEQFCTSITSGTITINGNTTAAGSLVVTHHEGKNGMEHHVDRLKLIETVQANKTAYDHIYERFQELYRAEIEKKTEEHVQGKIRSDQIMVRDEQGQIPVPQNDSHVYEDQLTVLNTDVRDVMILSDSEFQDYVMAGGTNLKTVVALAERLEAI